MVYIGMNRYENGKIYKVVDNGYNLCYIGSTCEKLSKRMERHRAKYKQYLKGKKLDTNVVYIFNEYGMENCKIELIENFPCENKEELGNREGYYIENLKCVNKRVEGRSKQEYYLPRKDYFNECARNYHEEHKEEISERKKKYYEERKEEITEKKREQYKENKDKIKEQYKQNREVILERTRGYYQREPILCKCGKTVCKSGLRRHERSITHQHYLTSSTEETEHINNTKQFELHKLKPLIP